MSPQATDVIVVGGGVMGCAAAYQLARAGRRVVLLERFGIGHRQGSSHGPSRIIRLAYDGIDYVRRLHAYATGLLPGLTGEIIEAVSCRYTMTPDEDFIIDRHPAYPQVLIASPCSGHGFKFGVVIGQILADLATRGATEHDISRFRIDRPALVEL